MVRADLHHPERHRAIEAWHCAARGQRSIAAPAMRYIALAALLLAACSGGGNNPTPPNPPWSKVAAHVLRLAGILAYLDWAWRTAGRSLLVGEPNQIGACFVTAAVRLVRDYFWPHTRAALRQTGLSERHASARRALRWICKNGKVEVSREGVRRDALGQSLDADQTQELLDGLIEAGWLRQITLQPGRHSGGRPRRRWVVNAKLFLSGTAGTAGTAVPPL